MEEQIPNVDGEECHVVALKNGIPVEISHAKSGRGYNCIGCGREMQAVIFKDPEHLSYFRHHPFDVDKGKKCTWSDEPYRHSIAKQILSRLKEIKVPAVVKYPLSIDQGRPFVIRKSRSISAHTVDVDLYFYENQEGEIHWQKTTPDMPVDEFVKADVVFFDDKEQPILLIQLVGKHRISIEKQVRIKNILIDTVQISVPKESSDAIEKSFSNTTRTKWIFNNEYERTQYISISSANRGDLSEADVVQRKLHEETLSCWTAEIRELIRSIGKCLSSKQYTDITNDFTGEISRVEGDIYTTFTIARENRERIERQVNDEFDSEENILRREEEEFEREEREVEANTIRQQRLYRLLETRYRTKIEIISGEEVTYGEKLADEEKSICDEIRAIKEITNRAVNANGQGDNIQRISFERERSTLERDITEGERRVREIENKINGLSVEDSTEDHSAIKRIKQETEREEKSIKGIRDLIAGLDEKFETSRREANNRDSRIRDGIKANYDRKRDELEKCFKAEDISGVAKLSEAVSGLLQLRGLILNLIEKQRSYNRIRQAYDCLNKQTYKNWPGAREVFGIG